jgi:hypothetical protein
LAFRAALAGVVGWIVTATIVPPGAVTAATPVNGAIAFAVAGLALSVAIELLSGFRRRSRFRPFSFITAGLVMAYLAFVGWTFVDSETTKEAEAAEARDAFAVESYTGSEDEGALQQTLAEFERSRAELAELWDATPEEVSRIHIRLYPTHRDFLEATRQPPSTLGITMCSGREATVAMPTTSRLQALITEGGLVSTTPRHELVHAMMCVVLGEDDFNDLPRWYHEGIAQVQQHTGFAGWPNRVMTMTWVSLAPESLPEDEAFCEGSVRRQVSTFYQASWAFARWLEFEYGEQAVRQLAFESQDRGDFDEAFADLTGSTCTETYAAWRARL